MPSEGDIKLSTYAAVFAIYETAVEAEEWGMADVMEPLRAQLRKQLCKMKYPMVVIDRVLDARNR